MRSQDILVKSLTVDEGEADVVVQEDIPEEEKYEKESHKSPKLVKKPLDKDEIESVHHETETS